MCIANGTSSGLVAIKTAPKSARANGAFETSLMIGFVFVF